MERRRTARVARGVMVSLLTIASLGAAPNEEKPLVIGPRAIELDVVDTWDALMKTTPVTVGGVQFHLGIESKQCAGGTGILVYCVPEKGYEKLNQADELPPQGEQLGPFYVQVVSNVDRKKQKLIDRQETLGKLRPVMFVAAARPLGPGPAEVQVVTRDGLILARRKIEVAKAADPGWRQLNETRPAGADIPLCTSGPAVLPHYDGSNPAGQVENLPHYLPEQPDESLQVAMDKGVVHVKSTRYVGLELDENWAVRWWINGKVAEDAALHKVRDGARKAEQQGKLPIEFSFRLELEPGTLKTKPGDVTEFQLLHSSNGFDRQGVSELRKRAFALDVVQGAWISKRVLFAP